MIHMSLKSKTDPGGQNASLILVDPVARVRLGVAWLSALWAGNVKDGYTTKYRQPNTCCIRFRMFRSIIVSIKSGTAVFAATGARQIPMKLWEKMGVLKKKNAGKNHQPRTSYILVTHSARQREDASGTLVKDLQFRLSQLVRVARSSH